MPYTVSAFNGSTVSSPAIESLDGIGEFDWTSHPTRTLNLNLNQISSIEVGTFSGLANLTRLELFDNQISSIEPGTFNRLTNLEWLSLADNTALAELNLAEADFSSLVHFDVWNNTNIGSVSLRNAKVNQTSLTALMKGDIEGPFPGLAGIWELDGITEMDLSGMDFANITNLRLLYEMDDLTDLWLVDTVNLNASDLDLLLEGLETIREPDTEGVLHMTQADFAAINAAGDGLLAAWDAEPGHHVEFLQLGDVNHDSDVNGLDVDEFIRVLLASRFDVAADMNLDGQVNGLDVDPFVAAVVGGTQPVPEPSTLLLALIALGMVGGWRKWKRAA